MELKALDAKLHGWDVDPAEIQICQREDGSDWVLGTGTFGSVRRPSRACLMAHLVAWSRHVRRPATVGFGARVGICACAQAYILSSPSEAGLSDWCGRRCTRRCGTACRTWL